MEFNIPVVFFGFLRVDLEQDRTFWIAENGGVI